MVPPTNLLLNIRLFTIRYVDKSSKRNTKLADIVDLEHVHAEGVKNGVFKAL